MTTDADHRPFDILNLAGAARSIAIVGNSPTLLDNAFGEDIDRHQCIIRINDGRAAGFEKHAGSRTDIRFIGVPLKQRYYDFFRNLEEGSSFIVTRETNEPILRRLGWKGHGHFDANFTKLMRSAFRRINRLLPLENIPELNPRSGIVVLSLLLDAMHAGSRISLYGFEVERRADGAEHFYDDGRSFANTLSNWDDYHCPMSYEFDLLRRLEGKGHIAINQAYGRKAVLA